MIANYLKMQSNCKILEIAIIFLEFLLDSVIHLRGKEGEICIEPITDSKNYNML